MRNPEVLRAIEAELAGHKDAPQVLDRVVEILKHRIPDYTWVGIYLLEGNELVLGPYRGKPSPHTRIPLGRGICGAAASAKATIIVDDVNADPRYLACSIETKSEIVVPIMRGSNVLGEIDIDSDREAAFTNADRELLEQVAGMIAKKLSRPPKQSEGGSDSARL
jgi:GAF domain-containing protein